MHRFYLIRKGLVRYVVLLLLLFLFVGVEVAGAGEGDVPPPHQALTRYVGPETCTMCHLSAAQDVVGSLHYQHQGAVPYREGWDEDVLGGMYVTY